MTSDSSAVARVTSSGVIPNSTSDVAGKLVEYIEADRLRIESPGEVTIFRADQNIAYMLVPADKKFMRMTPETMKLLAAAGQPIQLEAIEEDIPIDSLISAPPPPAGTEIFTYMASPPQGTVHGIIQGNAACIFN